VSGDERARQLCKPWNRTVRRGPLHAVDLDCRAQSNEEFPRIPIAAHVGRSNDDVVGAESPGRSALRQFTQERVMVRQPRTVEKHFRGGFTGVP